MTDRKISTRWAAAIAVAGVLMSTLPTTVVAQRGRTELNDGNRHYEEGRIGEAHEKYLEALRDAPGLPLALFNDGNALYESAEYIRALDAYRGAIESGDPALAGPAWYNLGNALYREQRFQESLEAYKEALRVDSGEIDYKHNFELALEQLQQQEQEQGEEEGQGNEDEEQEDQEGENSGSEDQEQQGEEDQEQDPEEDQNQGPPEESPEEDQPESEQPEPEPGEMTQEEAERLLQGVQEDPEEVNRRQAPMRGRRPSKPW